MFESYCLFVSVQDMFFRFPNHNHRSEWRYFESSFEFGEQVAVLGTIQNANVPGGKMMSPVSFSQSSEFFEISERLFLFFVSDDHRRSH